LVRPGKTRFRPLARTRTTRIHCSKENAST
jgi:hypothetical protein